jgi:arylsulfatase A-like enzyme
MNILRPILTLLTACVAMSQPARAEKPAPERPNIVVFIADDMSWNDLGAYGHPSIRTPNLDRLAREGMRFDEAWLTASSCSPSRASMLTGRYPHNTGAGQLHQRWPEGALLLTTPLREAGYWAAALGKFHPHGEEGSKQFDLVESGGQAATWLKALKQRPRDKPFFFWFASRDPHRGFDEDAFDPPHAPADVVVPPYLPNTPEVRGDLALYYDSIARLDSHVGEVLAELEAQGVLDNTMLLFLADNGRPFPRDKTMCYESSLRTPLLVRYPPMVKPGSRTESLVSAVDLAPTLLELAGVPAPSTFQGKSFLPVLRDPQAKVRDHAFAERNWHVFSACERAVITDRFNYIRNWRPDLAATPPPDIGKSPTWQVMRKLHAADKLPPEQAACFVAPRPEEELYDTTKDPHALRNLAQDPEYQPVMKEMRAALAAWQRETGDNFDPQNIKPDGVDRETFKKRDRKKSGPYRD